MTYDWMAALVFVGSLIAITAVGRFLVLRIPAFQRMRELNQQVDEVKLARPRFRELVRASDRAGMATNWIFYVAILPFSVNLEPRPLWRHVVDILVVLLVFDFMYYLTHRFLFHSTGYLGRVHALHHQVRKPTHADARFVHPLETAMGLALFLLSIPLVALLSGAPLHAFGMCLANLLFLHLNILNHTYVNLPYFPFKLVTRITQIHAAHHVDINRGNFAVLSTLYDWLLGTHEMPESRATP